MQEFEKWNNNNKFNYPLLETTIKMEREKAWKGALKKIKSLIIKDYDEMVLTTEDVLVFIEQELELNKLAELGVQYGREPEKVKSLAQYLDDYIEHEIEISNISVFATASYALFLGSSWYELLKQALDAYESTEQVKIRIERV